MFHFPNTMKSEAVACTWIAKDGTVLFDNDLDISQLPNHENRPENKEGVVSGGGQVSAED